jgi:hypothetical protein
MIILKQSGLAQEIKFIPRQLQATGFTLRNEITGEITSFTQNFTISDYYLTTSRVFNLKEFTYYNLTVLNGANIVYKGRIFCTNQVIKDYTVNENEYVQNFTNNDFVEFNDIVAGVFDITFDNTFN